MNFLSPGFLFGAVAVGAPLIAHLMRLRVNNRVEFSAMQFLEPTPPKKASKRWEDIVLMVARMAVLLLLSLAFARPYAERSYSLAPPANPPRRLLVLLDTSASMRRPGFFAEAREVAAAVEAQMAPADELALFTFDRTVRSVVGFDLWRQTSPGARRELLKGSLAGVEAGWAQTNLDDALKSVVEQTRQDFAGASLEVWVVSDFQEGAHLAKLQGQHWPENVRLKALPVSPKRFVDSGVSLQWMAPDPETSNPDAPARLRVSAGADFKGDRVKLRMEGERSLEWSVPVSAGKSRVAVVSGAVPKFGSVRVDGDGGPFSEVWLARKPESAALVAVEGKRPAGDHFNAAYFISEAFSALGSARVETVFGDELAVERVPSVVLWVSNGGKDPAWNTRMRAGIERGATGLLTLMPGSEPEALEGLIGARCELSEAGVPDFAVLGEIDHGHPVFAPFRSAQYSDFSGIRFWHYRKVSVPKDSGVRVLARFEGGDPALLESTIGQGRVFVWTSEWRPQDSQWVLSSRCVPFVSGCLDSAGGARLPFLFKSPLEPIPVPEGTAALQNTLGKRFPVLGNTVALEEPGVYEMQPSGGKVVVNVAPEESLTKALTGESLAKLGFGASALSGSQSMTEAGETVREALLVDVDAERRQGAWRYVLAAVLGCVLFETWWAGRMATAAKSGV